MAINIKELFDTDSNIIKTEKINYNFDQLVANGGGPTGATGQKGDVGPIGPTGNKGEKGDGGDKGQKGEVGQSTNFWDRFDNTDTGIDSYVMKPKNGTKSLQPGIFLGDETYDENGTSGITDPNAKLTIKKDGYDHHIKFVSAPDPSGVGTTEDLAIRGEYDSNISGSIYHIQGDATNGILAAPIKIKITAPFFEVNSTNANYASNIRLNGTTIDISGGGLTVEPAATFDNNLSVDGTPTFNSTDRIKIPTGTTAQRPGTPSVGMMRYNSETSRFEGYAAGAWKSFIRLEDVARDTFVAVEYDASQTGSADDKVVVRSNGQTYIRTNVPYNDDTTQYNTVEFSKPILMESSNIFFADEDTGLVFPEGVDNSNNGGWVANNFNSSLNKRRLSDYFAKENYTTTNALFARSGTGTYSQISSSDFSNSTFEVNYTKVGNMLIVLGKYVFRPIDWGTAIGSAAEFALSLGTNDQFAYTNTASFPIIVNVEVNYLQMDRGSSADANDQPYSYIGLIHPGENKIRLYWRNADTGVISPGSSLTNGYYSNLVEVNAADISAFYDGASEVNAEIFFSFSMPTDVESYQSLGTSSGSGS